MKYLLFLFIFIAKNAWAQYPNDPPATHGMFVFGTEKIYASHLPMFHSPHNYQVIFEIDFDPKFRKMYLENQTQSGFTIEPEKMILPSLVAESVSSFKANLFVGHFERGGKKIVSNIKIHIRKVIYFAKFRENAQKTDHDDYLLFGNKKEQFLAHKIVSSPDFDQILSVQIPESRKQELNLSLHLTWRLSENLQKPFERANMKGQIVANSEMELQNIKSLYLEFDDLK